MKKFSLTQLMLLTSFCLLWDLQGYGQNNFQSINMDRIPQKKIKNFINTQKQHNILNFKDVQPSCIHGQKLSNFYSNQKTYLIKEHLSKVWSKYKSVNPTQAWNGRIVSFGLLFSKKNNQIMYNNESAYSGLEAGQVFYINLRIFKGIYNLATAFEIIDVDKISKTIEFSYIKGGKAQGRQRIHFETTDKGYTKIVHQSEFKSDSRIRDKILYPFFHIRAINEFHRNVRRFMNDKPQIAAKHHTTASSL